MPKIKKLSPHIISQIAAGEVVERPAYAVKELIENAIDAGATQIVVNLKDSGLTKITISDNGSGMRKEDLLESFKPHTTSKLSKEEDLHAISSLGFRGEALASIASISDITLQSRSKNDVSGYKVTLTKGIIQSQSVIGMPHGTQISVSNIFSHVPARKKFLKSEKTELRHSIDIVSHFALSYPHIEFSLTHNDRTYFNFTKHQDLGFRIQTLLGNSLLAHLLPLEYEESYIKVHGYIARPQFSLKGQSKLFIFVNGRHIYDNLIANAIKDAYKNLLEYGAYPIAILYITLPFEMVDINIHPKKEQVRFIDQTFMYSVIQKAVTNTLQDKNLTFFNSSWKDGGTKTYLGKILKTELLNEIDQMKINTDLFQVHNIYIFTETKKGIMIFDQHATHEAVLFRKLKKLYNQKRNKKDHYQLAKPLLLDISISDAAVLFENREIFTKLGFELEEFGNQLRINSVPLIFKDRNIQDLILETLEDIREERPLKDIDKKTYRMLSYLSCRTAIKGGRALSKQEIKSLLKELDEADMAYTCPHGRPVKIEMSLSFLHTLFKRK